MPKRRVLIAGGSGYLGQFLARDLTELFTVGVTYNTHRPSIPNVADVYQVDVLAPDAAAQAAATLNAFRPDAVVNCIALPELGSCEKEPKVAELLNVPTWLTASLPPECLLIHISSDCVYNGTKVPCAEEDADPICVYGRTKLAGEQWVLARHAKAVVLRPSVIYGPPPFLDTPKGSFVQSLAESFRRSNRTPCFVDEVRKPVYVADMVRLVAAIVSRSEPSDLSGKVLNVGGPECCTRYEMAHAVMAAVGGTEDLLEERRATETDFGYRRPLDLSVDTRRLEALIPEVVFTPLAAALPLSLAPVPTSPPG